MPLVEAPPNIERAGVIGGFAIIVPEDGLAPSITRGCLFSQGVLYRPSAAQLLPPAPPNQQSWLFHNSVGGFYWRDAAGPFNPDDAALGWVRTDASRIVAASRQLIEVESYEDAGGIVMIGPEPLPVEPEAPGQLTEAAIALEVVEYRTDQVGKQWGLIRVTRTADPADADYVEAWIHEGATPPADPGSYRFAGIALVGAPIEWWQERPELGATFWVAVTCSKNDYKVLPSASTPAKSIALTAWHLPPQVTDFAVTVLTGTPGGVPSGKFQVDFGKPTDPEYWYVSIERIACDNTYAPLPGATWGRVFGPEEPFTQGEWWPLPGAPEYWRFRARSVNQAGQENDVAPPVVNVMVPASTGVAPPEPPGAVILGTPQRNWEYIAGVWYQTYAIAVAPPNPLNGFDRIYVTLQAPDDAVQTQKATIGPTAGFIIDDDPAAASRLVSLSEPEQKVELPWNPNEPVIRIKHPEPATAEKWRIIVTAGSPYGKSPSSVSVVVDASPHSAGVLGAEHCPNARNVTGTVHTEQVGADWYWWFEIDWEHPVEDPRYHLIAYWDIIIFDPTKTDDPETPEDERYAMVSGEPGAKTHYKLPDRWRVPDPAVTYTVSVRPRTADGATNTIVPGVTGSIRFAPTTSVGAAGREYADLVSALTWSWRYDKDAATGQPALFVDWDFVAPADPRYGGARVNVIRGDGKHHALTGLVLGDDRYPSWFVQLPAAAEQMTLYVLSVDQNNRTNTYQPGVTPAVTLTVQPPKVAIPLENATNFSVEWAYLGADYYGKETLRLTPQFTKPDDLHLSHFEFWAKGPDNEWGIVGYPSAPGVENAAIVDRLPSAPHVWEFALVAQDVSGRNRDGNIETTPGAWPEGTPTCTVEIQPPTGKLDGHKIENIPAAAFAAGLTAMHIGTGFPALPDAAYPPGTPFILTSVNPPKLYRVNSAGNGWTASMDGADIVARSIYGTSLVTGAVGTAELSTTEILVGPGGGRPIRFVVRDLAQTLLCLIGDDSSIPFTGAYFRSLKISPGILNQTNYIKCDGTVLEVVGATIRTSPPTSQDGVFIGPTYLDPLWGHHAVTVLADTATKGTYLIGRGVVLVTTSGYGPSRQIAALAVDPWNPSGGQLTLYGPYYQDGNYVFLNGTDGTVRADNGFLVSSFRGIGTRSVPKTYNLALAGGGSVTVSFVGGLLVSG